MREVSPGDLIFSFNNTRVVAIGIAQSYCWESPKPQEFGTTGQYWEDVGWRISVRFTQLLHQVRPKDHMEILRPVLPLKYSPLQPNGNGLQSVYLAEISDTFAEVLAGLIGPEARDLVSTAEARAAEHVPFQVGDDLDYWEHQIEKRVEQDQQIPETDREAIIRARRGQGLFKQRVIEFEKRCRITGVENLVHLVASHCKPSVRPRIYWI
jgi:putative restriction endonuclease